jgi:Holliday junction resolvase
MTRINMHGKYSANIRDVSAVHKSELFVMTVKADCGGEVHLYFDAVDELAAFVSELNVSAYEITKGRRFDGPCDPFGDDEPEEDRR